MDFEHFQQFVESARDYCRQKQDQTTATFALGDFARFDLDLARGTLCFFDERGVERVSATIQVAGSWSPQSQSWMWSWDNESIPPTSRDRMEAVRTFGIAEEIAMVAESFSPCGEVEAWAMASLACKFLETDGVYRVPGKASDLFLLLFDLHKKS